MYMTIFKDVNLTTSNLYDSDNDFLCYQLHKLKARHAACHMPFSCFVQHCRRYLFFIKIQTISIGYSHMSPCSYWARFRICKSRIEYLVAFVAGHLWISKYWVFANVSRVLVGGTFRPSKVRFRGPTVSFGVLFGLWEKPFLLFFVDQFFGPDLWVAWTLNWKPETHVLTMHQ